MSGEEIRHEFMGLSETQRIYRPWENTMKSFRLSTYGIVRRRLPFRATRSRDIPSPPVHLPNNLETINTRPMSSKTEINVLKSLFS
jgi:hypothetical protein